MKFLLIQLIYEDYMSESQDLINKLLEQKSELTKEVIEQKIAEKKEKIGAGYLTDDGALFLIAADLGITLEQSKKMEIELKDLFVGAKEVTVESRILNMSPTKQFTKKDGTSFLLRTITVYDSDSTASVKLWDEKANLPGIENLKPFGIGHFRFRGNANNMLMVSRTGFTGDLGYELWIEPNLALDLWDALYEVGSDYGIQPYGETATDMARLEAGFIMPGMEFNEALKTIHYKHDQSPFELGLGWLVDFKKPHFNGRNALLKEKEQGSPYTLVKLDIDGNKDATESYLYSEKKCKTHIGYITSTMWSPIVKANIALAMIETKYLKGEIWAEIYYSKEVRPQQKIVECKIVKKPFWSPARTRATPPERY